MLLFALAAHADPGVLGFYADPDVYGDQIVFVSEGDLWLVARTGGLATRLTSAPGPESHPRFSPDGRWIAFTGDHDGGGADVYVIPTGGGAPRRLSFHPDPEAVVGWTPDGGRVLYSTTRDEPLGRERLWSVPAAGGPATLLPLALGVDLDLRPDGHFAALVPFHLAGLNTRRYTGGTAADIWLGDLVSHVFRRLTTWEGEDHTPMWHGDTLFFLSDRAGLTDLWSVKADGTGLTPHTRHDDFAIAHAAIGGDTVVYTQGGDLWTWDIPGARATRLPVRLQSDQAGRRPVRADAAVLVTDGSPMPGGERMVLEARGRLVSVPVDEDARTIEVGTLPGRNRGVAVSPDGTRVAAWNDAGGDEALVIYDAAGSAAPTRPAGTSGPWHFPPVWSPTGDALAWGDATGTLTVLDLGSGKRVRVDQDAHLEIDTYRFSPDGAWIAWVRTAPNGNGVVWVQDRRTGARAAVTDPDHHSFAPAWDPLGRALYVLSARTYDPLVSGDDSSPAYATGPAGDYPEFGSFLTDMVQPLAILLDEDAWSPFLPPDPLRSAAVSAAPTPRPHGRTTLGPTLSPPPGGTLRRVPAPGAPLPPADADTPATLAGPLTLDLPGIVGRTVAVPLDPGNYTDLVATPDGVWGVRRPPLRLSDVNEDIADRPGDLVGWRFDTRAEVEGPHEVMDVVGGADGTVAVHTTTGWELLPPGATSGTGLPLGALDRTLDRQAEWTQIFEESWRAYRDFFWAPNLVGVDWAQKRAQYAPLAARVGTREELNAVVGQMIAELGNAHAYMVGGDGPSTRPNPTGLLGADLSATTDGVRIDRIHPGHSWDPAASSPLAAPGLNLHAGDYLFAVDGLSTAGRDVDPLAWFVGKGETDVVLRVGPRPGGPTREVVVHTQLDDHLARYFGWVGEKRAWVAAQSGGAIGYLHVRDMMGDGFADFVRGWFAQSDRAGLVLDLRNNGGGYVSQLLLDRLRRQLTGFVQGRNATVPESDAWRAFAGPLVVLVDEGTASDGEGFTNVFQTAHLGTVVGSRTWGGLVGYRVARTVVDGGFRSEPEFGQYGWARRWQVEGHGIDPDVPVENDPGSAAAGRDLQLEKAVELLRADVAAHPRPVPPPPAYPDLSLEAWRKAHPVQTTP